MKRKIFSIAFALVLVLSFSLVTAVPVAATEPPEPDAIVFPFELGGKADSNYVAEWDEVTVHGGSSSVYLATTGDVGSGNEARILIDLSDLPEGKVLTLGDIDKISWYEYLVAGYPPHLDISLDFDDDGVRDDILVFEYAYNTEAHAAEGGPTYSALTNGWYQTFSDDGDGPAVIDDNANAWLGSGPSGPLGDENFIYGTLADWKAGLVDSSISANTVILAFEIEVDNWIVQTEAYVDDITINDILFCGQIQDAIDSVGDNSFIYVMPGIYDEDVTINKSLMLVSIGGKDNTTINGQSTGETPAVAIAANDVVFGGPDHGFTVNGAGTAAVYFTQPVSGCKVVDNDIVAADTKNALLFGGGQSNHAISGNTFAGNASQLVYVNGQTSVGVASTSVNFIGNTFAGDATGPALGQEASNSIVSGNTFATVTGYASLDLWVFNPVHDNKFTADLPAGGVYVLDNSGVGPGGGALYSGIPGGGNYVLDINAVLSNNTFLRAVTVEHPGTSLLPNIWANIQDAIGEAETGDTINVAAGTYSGDEPLSTNAIEVNKSLTLLGANAGECAGVLPGTRGDESVIDDTTLAILASGVTIDGFLFDGGAMHTGTAGCIYAKNLSHLTISNNIFLLGEGKVEEIEIPYEGKSTPRRAMVLGDYNGTAANEMAVTCNDIHGLPGGSVYINPWTGVGTNVLFQYNSFHDNAGGICSDAAGLSILNNDFTGNGTGVSCTGNDVVVRDNNFDSNGTNIKIGSEWGFPVVTGVSILNNNIQNSVSDTGILLKDNAAAGNEAHFNNIVGNDIGVKNEDPDDTFAATLNWWGATDESKIAAMVDGNVNYTPWITGDIEPGAVDSEDVSGPDPEVTLKDSKNGIIADVDISDAPVGAKGTITAFRYTDEPAEETSLSVGTGTAGVVFLDVKVTGYASGIATITVPYPDVEEPFGIVDNTDPPVFEHTLGLYYWDEAASPAPMWCLAANNTVHPDIGDNFVSGDIPVSALSGTPIGLGSYEALVAIESILNLSYGVGDDPLGIVKLTIDTNTAFLGAATIDLTFDPSVVEVLSGENSAFDVLTVNLNYRILDNNTQVARFVAHQDKVAGKGVDATNGAVVAEVKLIAVGSTMDESLLSLEVITLKDNKGDTIPFTLGDNDSRAIVGGIGDADRDGVVDSYDCVYIARAIADFTGYSIDTPTMDVNGDGTVDAWDCTYLAWHLVGLGYPLGG